MCVQKTPEALPEILIVDDRPENLERLADRLQHEGYRVHLLSKENMELPPALNSPLQKHLDGMIEERTAALQQEMNDCKQEERALRESEHNLLKSQRIAHSGSWEYDVKTRTSTLSPEYSRIFGIEPLEENVPYEMLLDLIHPDDRESLRAAYRLAIQENRPYDGIHRIIRPSDGEVKYLHERCEYVTDESGRVVRLIGILQDITEHKRMERALVKEIQQRKTLMAEYQDGIVILDRDFRVVEANRRFAEMLGYTPEEVLNLHVWDWEVVTPKEKFLARSTEILPPHSVTETRHRRKDGTEFDVEVSVSARTIDGELLALCICRDITERKRMEQALAKEMRRRKTLMAGSRDGIVMINISQNHKAVEVNRRFAEMLGYTPEEVLNLHSWDWDAVMSKEEVLANFSASALSRGHLFETRHRRKDGTVFDVEVSSYREMVDGDILGLCICRDITERKRTEEELRQHREHLEGLVQERTAELTMANTLLLREIAERMRVEEELRQAKEDAEDAQRRAEAANRLKTEFLTNMSHEIRTPLNAVLGFAGVLERYVTDPKPQQYLRSIENGAHSLLSLINDILDLAKIETGLLELRPEPVNLRRLISNVTSMFQAEIAQKSLDLQIDIAPEVPQALLLDRLRLRQVLFNLLGNAVKFTEQGTVALEVTQTAHVEHDDPRSQQFTITFHISDTGIGIPADQHQCIFDAFRQSDGRRTRKYGGTGLGLALTQRLVDIMGGTISLTSEVGKGSRFKVVLRQVSTPSGMPSDSVKPCPRIFGGISEDLHQEER